MRYLQTYENFFYDKNIEIIEKKDNITFLYRDEDGSADELGYFWIKGDVATVIGYDTLATFGKGKGVDFILYVLEELKKRGIKVIRSVDAGRNEHSTKLWDKIEKMNIVNIKKYKDYERHPVHHSIYEITYKN